MAEAAHAQPAWALVAYLIAGVCFILALRGLSSPESSRRGNRLVPVSSLDLWGPSLSWSLWLCCYGRACSRQRWSGLSRERPRRRATRRQVHLGT